MKTKHHKTFLGKIFGSAWDKIKGWISDLFDKADHDILQFVVLATNEIKEGLKSGVVAAITGITTSTKDDELIAMANKYLDKVIANASLLNGLNENSSPEDAKAVVDVIVRSFGNMNDEKKAQLYSTIAANLYIVYMKEKHNQTITFAEAVAMVETAWRAYKQSKQPVVIEQPTAPEM